MGRRLASTAIAAVAAALLLPTSAFGAADVSVTVGVSAASIPFGGTATAEVTITASNAGPDPAENVSGSAFVGTPQLRFTGFKSISGGSASFNPGADPPITFGFGRIASGGTATLVYVIEDVESGTGVIQARVTTTTPESSAANNFASASIDVTALVPSASPLLFGIQPLGGAAVAKTLVLTNRAAVPVSVGGIQVSGGGFAKLGDECSGARLAVDASCQVTAQFAPETLGERGGALTVPSSTDKVSPLSVPLFGTAVDGQPPVLGLSGVPRALTERRFRKGFPVGVTPDEPVALEVELLGTPRAGALASAFELALFQRSLPLAGGARVVTVKPKGKLVGAIRRKLKVRLRIAATDAAGNPSSVVRTIAVKPSRRRR